MLIGQRSVLKPGMASYLGEGKLAALCLKKNDLALYSAHGRRGWVNRDISRPLYNV